MRLKVSNVCQLLDKSKFPATHTQLGCTFTNNGDGSFTINGTIQNGGSWSNPLQQITQNLYGHKILLLTNSTSDIVRAEMKFTLQNGSSKWGTYNSIYTVIYDNYKYLNIRIYMDNVDAGKTIDNATVKFQLFDLTEMYGAGHEPTTVAQFRQDFPNEMYEYSPECWKKFRRLKYVTETKNLFKFSNEVGTLTGGFGPNVARNFEEGKWYIGFTTNNYYSPNNIIAYSFKDNLIYYNGNGAGYGLSRAFKCEPNSNYNISCLTIGISGSGLGYIYAGFYDESGNYISNNNIEINNRSFTTPANCKWLIITLSTRGTAEVYFKDIQLELGSTATPYQPYGYLPLNRGKYIANKEPVQLLDKSKYRVTATREGITFTNNGDGTWTVVGTAPDDPTNHAYVEYTVLIFDKVFTQKHFIPGHKIIVGGGKVENAAWVQWVLSWSGGYTAANSSNVNSYTITEYPENFSGNFIGLRVQKGQTVNFTFKPQLFDLTEMYGAGNEPTTVAQFRADFPNELYDYNPYNAITFR